MRRRIRVAVALVLAGCAASVAAESVRMTGLFPAEQRDVAMLHSLAVDRFAGRDGATLAIAIERALLAPARDGRPYFDIVPISRGGDTAAEGVISGAVATDVTQTDFEKTEKRCVEKDGSSCRKYEDARIRCQRRVIDLRIDVRVADLAGNRILHSAERPVRDEASWCEGASPPRSVEEAVRALIGTGAAAIARSFAPRFDAYSIRFRESTKGMPRELQKRFKDAVRLTQRDLPAACRDWTAMEGEAPDHPSVVFNLGLCAEAAGDYAGAARLYARAQPLLGRGSEAEVGAERVTGLMVARRDEDARATRR